MNTFIYWSPRILSLLFVGFLSLFALDVFDGPMTGAMILGFLIHLLPSFALLALTFVAWRYPLVGAIVFIGFAVGYIWLVGFDRSWTWYAAISGPALIVGVLYSLNWMRTRNNKTI